MPSLQIRDLPEHIYQKLQDEAHRQHRSLAQQAIFTLSKGLQTPHDPRGRRKELISRIKSAALNAADTDSLRNPVELIREDREQR